MLPWSFLEKALEKVRMRRLLTPTTSLAHPPKVCISRHLEALKQTANRLIEIELKQTALGGA